MMTCSTPPDHEAIAKGHAVQSGQHWICMQEAVLAVNWQGGSPSSARPASFLWPYPATCSGQVSQMLFKGPRRRWFGLSAACWFASLGSIQLLLASQESKLTTAVHFRCEPLQSGAASIMPKICTVLALILLQAAACFGQTVAPPAGAPSGDCTLSVTGQVSASATATLTLLSTQWVKISC